MSTVCKCGRKVVQTFLYVWTKFSSGERHIYAREVLDAFLPPPQIFFQKQLFCYYKQIYANKIDNPEEMDKSLERYNLSRPNQEEIENMNRPIIATKIEIVI